MYETRPCRPSRHTRPCRWPLRPVPSRKQIARTLMPITAHWYSLAMALVSSMSPCAHCRRFLRTLAFSPFGSGPSGPANAASSRFLVCWRRLRLVPCSTSSVPMTLLPLACLVHLPCEEPFQLFQSSSRPQEFPYHPNDQS